MARDRQAQLVGVAGRHSAHVRCAVDAKGLRVPVALVVSEEQIQLGAQDQISGAPQDLMMKGLLQAAHQGCTSFTFGSGGDSEYLAVSSQPTPRTSMPSGKGR